MDQADKVNIMKKINLLSVKLFSFILLMLLWEIIALYLNVNTFPSMTEILTTLTTEIKDGEIFHHLFVTLYRVFVSFFLAMLIGTIIGIIMGNNKRVDNILDGWNILFLNIPALVIIILSYVWFGLTEIAAIIAVSLNKIPNVIVTIREGARTIDRNILEIAYVYKIHNIRKFFSFYLPQLYPYIIAAARGGIALIWKIVLVVELLGRSNGIGFKLHEFFQFFDIASILAYTFAFVLVMLFIENFLFQPFDNKLNKWRV